MKEITKDELSKITKGKINVLGNRKIYEANISEVVEGDNLIWKGTSDWFRDIFQGLSSNHKGMLVVGKNFGSAYLGSEVVYIVKIAE